MVDFCNTLLVILMVDCGEFHQGLESEKLDGELRGIASTHLVILTVNFG